MMNIGEKEFINEIQDDSDLIMFLSANDKKESSKDKYKQRISEYCQLHQMLPSELIDEALNEEKNPEIDKGRRNIRKRLTVYKEYLKNKGNNSKTTYDKITMVRGFYRHYEVILPPRDDKNKEIRRLKTEEDLPNKDILREALHHANKKYKAIITLMASSAMDGCTVRNLKYSQFLFAIQDYVKIDKQNELDIDFVVKQLKNCGNCIGVWKVVRCKQTIEYLTFSTPESIHFILTYLKARQNGKNPILSTGDYLFAGNKRKNNKTGKIKPDTFSKYFQRLNNTMELGKSRTQEKYSFFASHQLRRWAGTIMDGYMDRKYADDMLGHVKGETTEAYFKTVKNRLLKEYLKALDSLTIEAPTMEDHTNEKIQELEAKLKAKDEQLKIQEQQHQEEIVSLKAMLKSFNEKMDERVKNLEENSWMSVLTTEGKKPLSHEEAKKMVEEGQKITEKTIKKYGNK